MGQDREQRLANKPNGGRRQGHLHRDMPEFLQIRHRVCDTYEFLFFINSILSSVQSTFAPLELGHQTSELVVETLAALSTTLKLAEGGI